MDVSPAQIVSVRTALIPFLEHNDANRALMGANMQKQAVPLMIPQAPIVGTGLEFRPPSTPATSSSRGTTARSSTSTRSGSSSRAAGRGTSTRSKFMRSNQGTLIHQKPVVTLGDKVKKGEVLADGEFDRPRRARALGANLLVAFMPWEGFNFEDAIVISERLVKDDLSSIHIHEYEIDARSTKLGDEEITRHPEPLGGVAREPRRARVVRIGAEVGSATCSSGRSPKGETELTAEEKLIRAIFKEKAREVRDTCSRSTARAARSSA